MTLRGLLVASLALCIAVIANYITFQLISAPGPAQLASADRPFRMSHAELAIEWAIPREAELACGGDEVAGGEVSGVASFTHAGRSTMRVSSAWDVGNLLQTPAQFEPVGPAGGPVAPVLGVGDYPYEFHFNPFTGQCGSAVSATGEFELVAANGDQIFGMIIGGEAHRLDFVLPGDGVESFAIIEIVGGTGRFSQASGSFTAHTITRFDFALGRFVLDLAELLPGGTIRY